jgi:hypothetical protein
MKKNYFGILQEVANRKWQELHKEKRPLDAQAKVVSLLGIQGF